MKKKSFPDKLVLKKDEDFKMPIDLSSQPWIIKLLQFWRSEPIAGYYIEDDQTLAYVFSLPNFAKNLEPYTEPKIVGVLMAPNTNYQVFKSEDFGYVFTYLESKDD